MLTSGGHNAGIVSEPGHPNRRFRVTRWHAGERYVDPERWYANTSPVEGSWWHTWADWLSRNSSAAMAGPPTMGAPERGFAPLGAAPGTYVHER